MNLSEYYSSRKEMVDKAVREFLEREGLLDVSPTPLGGKRLRGVLTILVCEALGGKPEDALDAAVAVELAHAASLDVDDIIDFDVLRRGNPATWVLKGVVKTVVGSHGLVAAAYRLVERYGYDAVRLFNETYLAMVRGEVRDALEGGAYEAIVGAKTASLWATAAALGALAAGKRERLELAKNYGYSVGMAFQIADDIVDVTRAIERGELMRLLKHPSSVAFLVYIGLETLLHTNPLVILWRGLDTVKERARNLALKKLDSWVKRAQGYAHQFPESQFKQLLIEYPTMCVNHMLEEMAERR